MTAQPRAGKRSAGSLRRVDGRFFLPFVPRNAIVLGDLEPWRRGLREAGVDVLAAGAAAEADVVVAPTPFARVALRQRARAFLFEGPVPTRALRHAGLHRQVLWPLPSVDLTDIVLPLGQRAPAAYTLVRWRPASGAFKRLRNRLLVPALASGVRPPGRALLTVAARDAPIPAFVAQAQAIGTPGVSQWVATFPPGESLARGVFHVFAPGRSEPSWAIKFARVRGIDEPFRRDERGLGIARLAGGPVAARAPGLLGRFEVDGYPASVETAAVGTTLQRLLVDARPAGEKLRLVEIVVEWIRDIARQTLRPTEALAEERSRLERDVLPRWRAHGVSDALLARIPPVPAVLQHNDLWEENVIFDDDSFTVIDWEWAQPAGFPLWDLARFASLALGVVDGARSRTERDRHFLELHRGTAPSSTRYFAWLRSAADDLHIPLEAVGAILTLHWLDHGLRVPAPWRSEEAGGPEGGLPAGLSARMAHLWLTEPGLGPAWQLA